MNDERARANTAESEQIAAARALASHMDGLLGRSAAFANLEPATQSALRADLQRIRHALESPPSLAPSRALATDPYAVALETPAEAWRRRQMGLPPANATPATTTPVPMQPASAPARPQATETLAARAGALSDEIDFAGFVASLVHGTFDALLESSIRQMEAFAGLVSAVAQDVDRFTSENVTPAQVRAQLAKEHPADLSFGMVGNQPRIQVRAGSDDEPNSPAWLADYGLAGEELSEELVEEAIVPMARRNIGEQRMHLLATMVLLGMNRIVVRDGAISAKVRFRAAARDRAAVDFALATDGSSAAPTLAGRPAGGGAAMMVSTVGANVQAESELRAELFGEVRINFASETLPLDRFADAAAQLLLQRNAQPPAPSTPATLPAVAQTTLPDNAPPLPPPTALPPAPAPTPPA